VFTPGFGGGERTLPDDQSVGEGRIMGEEKKSELDISDEERYLRGLERGSTDEMKENGRLKEDCLLNIVPGLGGQEPKIRYGLGNGN